MGAIDLITAGKAGLERGDGVKWNSLYEVRIPRKEEKCAETFAIAPISSTVLVGVFGVGRAKAS